MTRSAFLCALLLALPACHHEAPAPARAAAQTEGRHAPGSHAHRSAPATEGQTTLEVTVNGQPAQAWTPDRLSQVAPVQVSNRNGEGRQGWSLKDLARSLVGPNARVVALASDENDRIEIPEKQWFDPSRTLVMRPTHRGDFKVQWVSPDGSPSEAVLKHLARVELAQ